MIDKNPNCLKNAFKKCCLWPFERAAAEELVEKQIKGEVHDDTDANPEPDSGEDALTMAQEQTLDELLVIERIIERAKKPVHEARGLVRFNHVVTDVEVADAIAAKRAKKEEEEKAKEARKAEKAVNKAKKDQAKKGRPLGLSKAQKRGARRQKG